MRGQPSEEGEQDQHVQLGRLLAEQMYLTGSTVGLQFGLACDHLLGLPIPTSYV